MLWGNDRIIVLTKGAVALVEARRFQNICLLGMVLAQKLVFAQLVISELSK